MVVTVDEVVPVGEGEGEDSGSLACTRRSISDILSNASAMITFSARGRAPTV